MKSQDFYSGIAIRRPRRRSALRSLWLTIRYNLRALLRRWQHDDEVVMNAKNLTQLW